MRYEQLMQRYQSTACCAQTNETHAAILSLIELFSLTARIDLKADIIREIERIIVNLEKLGRYSSVNQEKRCSLINLLREQMSRLHAINGPLGGHLKDHELFNMLRQRSSVPGGINAFDLPQYHHWLNELETERQELLTEWIMPFEKIHHPISLLLTMIRESSNMKSAVAASGYYQQLLDSAHPHLMLRISLPANSTLYPEISSGKHRFNIRFLEISNLAIKAQQTADDIQFQLSCCSL
jgi:cell division protein ZapD